MLISGKKTIFFKILTIYVTERERARASTQVDRVTGRGRGRMCGAPGKKDFKAKKNYYK